MAAAAAAPAGALAESVFVKAAGPRGLGKQFLKVATSACADVADLAVRVTVAFPAWNVGAEDIALFLIKPAGGERAFATPTQAQIDTALADEDNVLGVGVSLSHAGISSGAGVVARLLDPPAAAPGECARARLAAPLRARRAGGGEGGT